MTISIYSMYYLCCIFCNIQHYFHLSTLHTLWFLVNSHHNDVEASNKSCQNMYYTVCSSHNKAHTHTNIPTHTHNRFTALWNLSGTTQVSRYQKKHSPTTLIVVINHPYIHPNIPMTGIFCMQEWEPKMCTFIDHLNLYSPSCHSLTWETPKFQSLHCIMKMAL